VEATKLLDLTVGNIYQVADNSVQQTTLARANVANNADKITSFDFEVYVPKLNELTQCLFDGGRHWFNFLAFLSLTLFLTFVFFIFCFLFFGRLTFLESPAETAFYFKHRTWMIGLFGHDNALLDFISEDEPLDSLHRDYQINES
jgi:hypothetical protein